MIVQPSRARLLARDPQPCVRLPDHVLESRVAAQCVHVRIGLDPVQCYRADSRYVGPEYLERRVVVADDRTEAP